MGNEDVMEKVVQHLKAQDRSLSWLGRQLGVHRSTVQSWVAGRHTPSRAVRIAIALTLNESMEDLFNE